MSHFICSPYVEYTTFKKVRVLMQKKEISMRLYGKLLDLKLLNLKNLKTLSILMPISPYLIIKRIISVKLTLIHREWDWLLDLDYCILKCVLLIKRLTVLDFPLWYVFSCYSCIGGWHKNKKLCTNWGTQSHIYISICILVHHKIQSKGLWSLHVLGPYHVRSSKSNNFG